MIVLSRKGLDSSIGKSDFLKDGRTVSPKIPHSLILSDGRMLSIPIPEIYTDRGRKGEKEEKTRSENRDSGVTYGDFIRRLKGKVADGDLLCVKKYLKGLEGIWIHQDPDVQGIVSRENRALFGVAHDQMINPVLTGLLSRDEKITDLLFLFFGLFKRADSLEGKEFHAVWGFMKPERCVYVRKDTQGLEETLKKAFRNVVPKCAIGALKSFDARAVMDSLGIEIGSEKDFPRHPHCVKGYQGGGDFIFVSESEDRYGTFYYDDGLRLTAEGGNAAQWRTDVFPWFQTARVMTPNGRVNPESIDAGGRWQEAAALSNKLSRAERHAEEWEGKNNNKEVIGWRALTEKWLSQRKKA